MKKIGTVSLALSFIFLGTVLVFRQINQELSLTIFRFWPTIFIVLGMEILIFYTKDKSDNTRKGKINWGIIFMILFFLLLEGLYSIKYNIFKESRKYNIDFNINDVEGDRYLNVSDKVKIQGEILKFNTYNGKLKIKKSPQNEFKFEGKIFLKANKNVDNYEINPSYVDNFTEININEEFIKSVEGTIYVPENIDIYLSINNVDLENLDNFDNSNLHVHSNNGNFKLSNYETLNLDTNNGNIDIKDIYKVKVKANNAKINMYGSIEEIYVESNISVIDVVSNEINEATIINNGGKVSLKTNKEDLAFELKTGTGAIFEKGKKIEGKSYTKEGKQGKVYIKTDIGAISVN